jgi:hypothetical protein
VSILGTLGVVGATIGAAGSVAAGSEQAGAAKSAAQLQAEEAANSLAFQKQQWETQQGNIAPFLKAGQGAIGQLSDLLSKPGEGLLAPWTQQFTAPTAAEAAATPGYQFQLQQGEQQVQNSAAAAGGVLGGGTLKGIENYGQGLAASNYQQVYNNAIQQYQQAYNIFQNNQNTEYNRLAGISGAGQTAAATLGAEGSQAAGTVANINEVAGGQIGQSLQNAGAATASCYVGAGNAINAGIGNISSLSMLQQLLQNQQQNPTGQESI